MEGNWFSKSSHWDGIASPRTHLTSHLFFFLSSPPPEGGHRGIVAMLATTEGLSSQRRHEVHGRGPLILIYPSTTATTAVDDEGSIAVRHLEGTGIGALTFSQGDAATVEHCSRGLAFGWSDADGYLGTLCDFSSAVDGITSYGDTGGSAT